MRSFPVIAALAISAGVAAHRAPLATRPWELVVRADGFDGVCQLVSFQPTQINKDLVSHDDVTEEVTLVPAPEPLASASVIRTLSYDARSLVSRAQLHCSNDLLGLLLRHGTTTPAQGDGTQVSFSEDDAVILHSVPASDVDVPPLELIPLITSGSAENRVDLAFFADGYTAEERQKFVDDASRLAQDMSANQTFFTVKPLLNFWAVFTPSKEVFECSKDTPFGLYRDGTELRGLYANNSDVALAACASLGDKCNYAILLANDPLYGGLGGEYTTTTASLANGALVLRHEIGHSVIDVGEEYDGGFEYFGVNAIHDPTNVTWSHWLTHQDTLRVERSVMPMQAYPWTLLDMQKPWSYAFSSSGEYSRHLIKFSLSGIPRAEDLVVYLDGADLRWTPRKDIGVDRWHYDISFQHGLSMGEHVIEFALQNGDIQGQAQLCSVEILEYGTQHEFDTAEGYYSLFPTYNLDNETSYRPTNDDCLMRSVVKPNFCKVCLEGLWLSLLRRVDLIEDLRSTCSGPSSKTIEVVLVKLAQFRELPIKSAESYMIQWSKDGQVLERFTNRTTVELESTSGTYRVDVTYSIDEVRSDPKGYLTASRTFDVTDTPSCAQVYSG
ncbi:IgA peptidase M64-domain-containing protein [Melanogaster broomeanus]|nr:IgA peptidase M64-domain-containing protein [Melanogaster broomeanus]